MKEDSNIDSKPNETTPIDENRGYFLFDMMFTVINLDTSGFKKGQLVFIDDNGYLKPVE